MKRIALLLTLSLLVASSVLADGIDSYTKAMLHMDGSDASTTFTDSSLTPKTYTAIADAQIDTAQSVFGGASGLFDGTGDALSTTYDSDFDLGTSLFTIDFRLRFSTVATAVLFQSGQSNSGENAWGMYYATGQLHFYHYNTSLTDIIAGSWTPSADTWYHVAIIRGWSGNANDFAITINGSSINSGTDSVTVATPTANVRIACQFDAGVNKNNLNGWIDEFRYSKGIARWTANFTPPTSEYSADSGTTRRPYVIS